jgi:hypothetical protein
MTSGGARTRSGPPPDPDSRESERRGYSLEFLPPAGYDGPIPEFPLPDPSERELAVWAEAWRSPQACAWSMPAQTWMHRTIGLWVRTSVRAEQPNASVAILGVLHRFADQVGMTTAGLQYMGWRVGNAPQTNPAPTGDDHVRDPDDPAQPTELDGYRERRLRA